jgi:UDP-N-acetylmuramoylalanine--D-glutamate ligase
MIPSTVFSGRSVAVFGLGLSGIAAAKALAAGGAEVLAWDDVAASREKAASEGIALSDLNAADWSRLAALVLAPGVPLTHPEPHWTVVRAQGAGVEIIGDTELFFRERAKRGSSSRVIAITGTNGKSTTTALTAHLLQSGGKQIALGGNIGRSVLDLPDFSSGATYVLELSTFQIELTPGLSANGAALLNITPDHLDRHGTLEAYAAIKARIFDELPAGGTAVIGVDDEHCRTIADRLSGSIALKRISVEHPVESGIFVEDGVLVEMEAGKELARLSLAGIGSLRGSHNWQNAAVAYALAKSEGLSPEAILAGLQSFAGLAHRMEQVGHIGHVLFVNDSKATNADAAAKALSSFADIYWIIGGRAKSGGIASLEPFFPRIARAYLVGEATEEFAAQLGDKVEHERCETLARAVEAAASDAMDSDAKEGVVLLSPACASYDQFANFEERGNAFRALVLALPGLEPLRREEGIAA